MVRAAVIVRMCTIWSKVLTVPTAPVVARVVAIAVADGDPAFTVRACARTCGGAAGLGGFNKGGMFMSTGGHCWFCYGCGVVGTVCVCVIVCAIVFVIGIVAGFSVGLVSFVWVGCR